MLYEYIKEKYKEGEPMKVGIASNNMAAKKRDVVIGNKTFIVHRPAVKMKKENF
ncbi:MAG: hypothetical protein HDR01_16480 [Lachnospiraceae bacterium]|nr:hypothetical protein [Lachnospiraceae bacterium]